MSGLTFRRATEADVDVIVSLVESAYRGQTSRVGWTTEAHLLDGQRTDRDEVSELITDPANRILLASEDARVVGTVLLEPERDGAYLGMFAIMPTRQAKGVGRALLAHAEHVAKRELDARFIEMTVIAQRPELIAWYERRGYQRTGETRAFPYGDFRFGEPRREDLYFEVLSKKL